MHDGSEKSKLEESRKWNLLDISAKEGSRGRNRTRNFIGISYFGIRLDDEWWQFGFTWTRSWDGYPVSTFSARSPRICTSSCYRCTWHLNNCTTINKNLISNKRNHSKHYGGHFLSRPQTETLIANHTSRESHVTSVEEWTETRCPVPIVSHLF